MNFRTLEENCLIRLVQQDVEGSFAELCRRYQSLLTVISKGNYRYEMRQDEYSNRVLLLHKSAMKFDPGKGSFRNYASTAMNNGMIDVLEKESRRKHCSLNTIEFAALHYDDYDFLNHFGEGWSAEETKLAQLLKSFVAKNKDREDLLVDDFSQLDEFIKDHQHEFPDIFSTLESLKKRLETY